MIQLKLFAKAARPWFGRFRTLADDLPEPVLGSVATPLDGKTAISPFSLVKQPIHCKERLASLSLAMNTPLHSRR
jgi:hypothetical protein